MIIDFEFLVVSGIYLTMFSRDLLLVRLFSLDSCEDCSVLTLVKTEHGVVFLKNGNYFPPLYNTLVTLKHSVVAYHGRRACSLVLLKNFVSN
jgi:hypothetical protein